MDPDQIASSEARLHQKPADLDLNCFSKINLGFSRTRAMTGDS